MQSNSDPNIHLNKEKSRGEGVVGGAEPQNYHNPVRKFAKFPFTEPVMVNNSINYKFLRIH